MGGVKNYILEEEEEEDESVFNRWQKMARRKLTPRRTHPGLYTDESPGLKVDPVVVLVLSLGFIFSVVALHSMSLFPPPLSLPPPFPSSPSPFLLHPPTQSPLTSPPQQSSRKSPAASLHNSSIAFKEISPACNIPISPNSQRKVLEEMQHEPQGGKGEQRAVYE